MYLFPHPLQAPSIGRLRTPQGINILSRPRPGSCLWTSTTLLQVPISYSCTSWRTAWNAAHMVRSRDELIRHRKKAALLGIEIQTVAADDDDSLLLAVDEPVKAIDINLFGQQRTRNDEELVLEELEDSVSCRQLDPPRHQK